MQRYLGLDLPRQLQILFSKVVQDKADSLGRELKAEEIVDLLKETYNIDLCAYNKLQIVDYKYDKKSDEITNLFAIIELNGEQHNISGTGNGPISSLLNALGKFFKCEFEVEEYAEHSVGSGSKTKAASYIKLDCNDKSQWGIGTHESITKATVNSILSVVNNLLKNGVINK